MTAFLEPKFKFFLALMSQLTSQSLGRSWVWIPPKEKENSYEMSDYIYRNESQNYWYRLQKYNFFFLIFLVHSWLSWHRGTPLLVHPSHQSQVGAQEPEADVGPLGQPLHRPERQAAADRKSGCRLDQRKRSHFWLLLVAVMYLFLQFRHLKFLKFLKFQFFFWQLIFFVTLIILNWNSNYFSTCRVFN